MAVDPCSVCGSNDLNLIDGYYYCVECGTQDTNVRETLIDQEFFADGTLAMLTKKKILINQEKVEMSGEWYKWHTYNFILNGLADELIALGAKPSFKTKLLWIWIHYVKKYQKKEDIGLSQLNETEASMMQLNEDDNKNDLTEAEKKTMKNVRSNSFKDLSIITSGLLISMLYTALNLDRSDIQISHLFRFMDEGRLIVDNFDRHIPEGVIVKYIPDWIEFKISCSIGRRLSTIKCRWITMILLKKLDLGSPVVPDIRKIINNYTTDLCLPAEFKNLVFSLMDLWPCDFLDIDSRDQNSVTKVPDYEGVAIAYVLISLKMCFGLDDDYEYRLSEVIDKFNNTENFSKCYKIGFTPEPTGRLFSFREWISYLQFRRKILTRSRLLNTTDEHYLDVDDYIYMEYLKERPKGKVTMTQELSMDIVNKLNLDKDVDVIPKQYFPPTLTPSTSYTEVLAQNCRHTRDVELLSEDYTQYCLKYACESLHLTQLGNNDNLILGINDKGKTITEGEIMCGYLKGVKKKQYAIKKFYVKNCPNKNWLKTNKPTMDHVIINSNEITSHHDEKSDHGYDSNLPSTPSNKEAATEPHDEDTVLETIREEDDDKNIFDDTFESIDNKEEFPTQDKQYIDNVENIELYDEQFDPSDEEDKKGIASTESFEFNPETFNRERAIKELILHSCKKYKIPIPKEYKTSEPKKRKREHLDDVEKTHRKSMKTAKQGEVKNKVSKLLEAYYSHLEKDVISQVSQQLNLILHNMNQSETNQEDTNHDTVENLNDNEQNNLNIHGYTNVSEISSIALDSTQVNMRKLESEQENIESTLFNEESDCDNIDDIAEQNDPKFDEAKYDINQLYIKIDDVEPKNIYESIQDPELDKIIKKKIEECQHSKITIKAKRRRKMSSDSDDEIPLSVLKKEKETCLNKVNENVHPLITNYNIPKIKYWVKRYNTVYMAREQNVREKFDSEIMETMPKTFNFLLKECAIISGCTQFNIYKCLQHLERNLVCCARKC